MKPIILCLFAVLLAPALQAQEGFKPLFNGKDLDGWKVPADNVWFTIEEGGELLVKSGPKKKGQILRTKERFTNFHAKLDFKFGEGTIDSGVFIRNDKEQIQIGISGSLKRDMTASPYIPGKGYPVEAEGVKDLLKMEDWNTLQVRAVGNKYTSWLNGKEVMNYESKSAAKEGPIGIQLHGNRVMSIRFRNLSVKALD